MGKEKEEEREREQLSNLSELQTSTKTIFDLPQLYEKRLFISNANSNDLKHLCTKNIILRRFHNQYYNYPTTNDAKDTLFDTDEDDSEID